MGGYYHDNASRLLGQLDAHPDADPAPLARAAQDSHGDMRAGVMLGQDGAIHARTTRDASGTYRVHEGGADWASDIWTGHNLRRVGPTAHVPLWRVFSGPS